MACFWQPRAAQSPAGRAEPHIHPHTEQPKGSHLRLPPQWDTAHPIACQPKGRVRTPRQETGKRLLWQGKGKHSDFQESICASRRRAQIHQSFLITQHFP